MAFDNSAFHISRILIGQFKRRSHQKAVKKMSQSCHKLIKNFGHVVIPGTPEYHGTPRNTRNSTSKPGTPRNTFQKTPNIPEQPPENPEHPEHLSENPEHLTGNQKWDRKLRKDLKNVLNTLTKPGTPSPPTPPPQKKKYLAKIYCHHFPLINETSASCFCLIPF